jgi:hypothetical protein
MLCRIGLFCVKGGPLRGPQGRPLAGGRAANLRPTDPPPRPAHPDELDHLNRRNEQTSRA